MPDSTQSTALREARTHFDPSRRELQTLGLRQSRLDVADLLDLVFVMDTTGSMGSYLEAVADSLAAVAAGIASEYSSVQYAVVDFKDEFETSIVTGEDFVNLATAQAALDALVADGGDDDPENGFGALYMAKGLPWRDEAARVMILITDVESHERGASFTATKNALLNNGIFLFVGMGEIDEFYSNIVEATGGAILEDGSAESITAQLIAELKGIANPVQDPIYLVNDSENFEAFLETGEEVEFLARSFALNPFNSGEDGNLSISLTIDNTDFAVSRYLAKARRYAIALEVTLRVYFKDDNSAPQNSPPMALFATDFETKGSTVSCQVRFLDLQNAPFPNAYYTAARAPSLQ